MNTALLKFARVPGSNVHYTLNWRERGVLLSYSGQLSTYIVPNRRYLQILINYSIFIRVVKGTIYKLLEKSTGSC